MSFSSDTKAELAALDVDSACCRFAECYGLVLMSRCFSLQEKSYVTESFPAARKLAESLAEEAGIMAEIVTSIRRSQTKL